MCCITSDHCPWTDNVCRDLHRAPLIFFFYLPSVFLFFLPYRDEHARYIIYTLLHISYILRQNAELMLCKCRQFQKLTVWYMWHQTYTRYTYLYAYEKRMETTRDQPGPIIVVDKKETLQRTATQSCTDRQRGQIGRL